MPDDFFTHQASWRKAIVAMCEGPVDKDYWAHELRAFDRAYAELEAQQKEKAQP